jgi:hypothetical protein
MLLRWNIKDLAFRSAVDARRIRQFEEHNKEQIYLLEIKNLRLALEREGIIFTEDTCYVRTEIPKYKEDIKQNTAVPVSSEDVLNRLLGITSNQKDNSENPPNAS